MDKIKEELTYLEMFLGTVAIFLIVMVGPAIIGHIETHYTREECVVVNIVDDEVIVKDKGDRLWTNRIITSNTISRILQNSR